LSAGNGKIERMFESGRISLMDTAQEALALVLAAVGVDSSVKTRSERKTVQKAIYLAQASGVDLGYRYSWYVMGPYSPALTKDYFALQDTLRMAPDAKPTHRLRPVAYEKLARLATVVGQLKNESDVPLADWLELLASVHFLEKQQGRDEDTVRARLAAEKPHVAPYFDEAKKRLEGAGLM
jgi:hypothetical protein